MRVSPGYRPARILPGRIIDVYDRDDITTMKAQTPFVSNLDGVYLRAKRDIVRQALSFLPPLPPEIPPADFEQRDILRLVWGVPIYLWVVTGAIAAGALIWYLAGKL